MTTDTTPAKDDHRDRMLQIMIAEYAALQSASAGTIYDSGGRVNLYIGSISGVLVALAFIGQAVEMGQSFFIFALVLLLPLLFIGLTTFDRTLQIATEDVMYRRGMNRIRHFYTEVVPETKPYFILSTSDDMASVIQQVRTVPSVIQLFLSTPGMVSGLNSLLLGACLGILLSLVFGLTLLAAILVASIGFLISFALHTRYQTRQWRDHNAQLTVLFPSDPSRLQDK